MIRFPNAEYVLPFLFSNDLFIPVLQELFKNEKNNPVKYVYGTVQNSWAGGRVSSLKITNLNKINNYLYKLKSFNVSPCFTFTNISTIKQVLNDEYSNTLLDIAYDNDAYFIVASQDLYKHIKSRYKNAKMICSVISAWANFSSPFFNETKFYNSMLDKYDIVVIRPEYAIDNADKMEKLISDLDRIEILANSRCVYNCPNQLKHYILLEQLDRKIITEYEFRKKLDSFCIQYDLDSCKLNQIDINIVDKLINKGITKIKLSGRGMNFSTVFNYIYNYLFDNQLTKEEIANRIDLICAKMIQENKAEQFSLVKNIQLTS